jgi:hypothetical protein
MDSPFMKRSKLGKVYSIVSQTREIILNLSEYFEKNIPKLYPQKYATKKKVLKGDIIDQITTATKISITTIENV